MSEKRIGTRFSLTIYCSFLSNIPVRQPIPPAAFSISFTGTMWHLTPSLSRKDWVIGLPSAIMISRGPIVTKFSAPLGLPPSHRVCKVPCSLELSKHPELSTQFGKAMLELGPCLQF